MEKYYIVAAFVNNFICFNLSLACPSTSLRMVSVAEPFSPDWILKSLYNTIKSVSQTCLPTGKINTRITELMKKTVRFILKKYSQMSGGKKIDSSRLLQCVPMSAKVFKNCIEIKTIEEVDKELLDWLKAAYHLKD